VISVVSCRIHRCKRGFTLIELLVAMTILGLLAGLGAGLLHLSGRSWEKANSISANVATLEAVQALLRAELSRARLASGDDSNVFDGKPDSVMFYTTLPEALDATGPTAIRIRRDVSDAGRNSLVMEWYDRDKGVWRKSVLLTDIKDAHFAYYGAAVKAATVGWQSSWNQQNMLPQAIRLDITFTENDTRFWPRFIVVPMITSDISCLQNLAGVC
jgi:general secretion pathway protein J